MGEALMFRAGGDETGGGKYKFVTEIYETNTTFIMPSNVKDNQVYVRIFGAGGGGGSYLDSWDYIDQEAAAGGGGGWVIRDIINIVEGEVISITIGTGGNAASYVGERNCNGGITSFGTYLSANGGGSPYSNNGLHGGDGGAGGGAASIVTYNYNKIWGGNGYQFGGGGVIAMGSLSNSNIHKGIGGPNGGNGGIGMNGGYQGNNNHTNANDGINTILSISESDSYNADCIGYGKAGNNLNAGSGGGGYGANGGDGYGNISKWPGIAPGGGGGYGKGGTGGCGYFRLGNETSVNTNGITCGGGGSYGCGGGYNVANNSWYNPGYGGGGRSGGKGGSGLVILQYYKKG